MTKFFLARLARFAGVLVGASLIVFVALHLLVDPVRQMMPLGTDPEVIDQFRRDLGLDRSFFIQYGDFVWGAITQGDFGESLWLGVPALEAVLDRLPATAALSLLAIGVATLIGVVLGVTAATSKNPRYDKIITGFSHLAISLSEVWVGIMLVLLFAVQLGAFRTSGYGFAPHVLILPLATLALRPTGRIAQVARDSMLAEGKRAYIVTAEGKGLQSRRIRYVHQLKNALPSIVTFIMYDLGRLFAGTAVVVETLFGWPGIGRLAVEALERGDIFLVQAVVIVAATIVGLLNLFADVVHLMIDPRIRTGSSA